MLTIELSGFDLLKKGLEPAKGGCVTTDPKELDTTKRAEISLLLTVPNMFQNGGEGGDPYGGTLGELGMTEGSEWGHTDAGTDKHSDLVIKDVLCRGTIRTIYANSRERTSK